jgi:GNAT superfamily N-acetyltransferase
MIVEIRELERGDNRSDFDCGNGALNLFFHRYAGQNQFRHHIGVTYIALIDEQIVGYATVSPASLDADKLPSRRKLPFFPVPVLRIARLAVAAARQGLGIGKALLRFCFELAEKLRDEYGCVGVVVDAKKEAKTFYEQFGFIALDAVEGRDMNNPPARAMYLPLAVIPPKNR